MRWLQWSTIDLENGLGGVEVHARSLARELKNRGIEAAFSTDPKDLDDPRWDVIQTHGSAYSRRGNSPAIRIQTLHGTTLGRMASCREWTWPGGYAAEIREIRGILGADIVVSVHPELSLYHLARRLGKTHAVCWNGWDPSDLPGVPSELPIELRERLASFRPFWIYIGRGEDRVKGADRLKKAMPLLPDLHWVAAPGSGFSETDPILKTGRLSSPQVRELMGLAEGLILPSRYEGNSLVLLEALALGLPVVSTRVGAAPVLPSGIDGLFIAESGSPRDIAAAIRLADSRPKTLEARRERAEKNRSLLPSWSQVAETCIQAVQTESRKRLPQKKV